MPNFQTTREKKMVQRKSINATIVNIHFFFWCPAPLKVFPIQYRGNYLTWRVWAFQCIRHKVTFPGNLSLRAQSHDLDSIRDFHTTLWIGRRKRHHADVLVRVLVDASSWSEVGWQVLSTYHLATAAWASPMKKFCSVISMLLCWL